MTKWVNILQPLISKYNSTKHHSTGFTPTDARRPSNREQVFKNLYSDKVHQKLTTPKFAVGERVRLALKKDKFEKAFIINWSDKVYKIKEIKKTNPPTYLVADEYGRLHKGSFYTQELQKIHDDRFRIEKILRYKTVKGRRLALVKWIGYDRSESTWESADKIETWKSLTSR